MYNSKSWTKKVVSVFFILFVLVDAILLSFTLQKRTSVKMFFKASTPSPNIFAPYIKNLGMCFAILVYFDFGYVCIRPGVSLYWPGS